MTEPIALSALAASLNIDRGELVSLVGGGGKTTNLFALGDQLRGTTVLTTTTKMGSEQTGGHTVLLDPPDALLTATLRRDRLVLAWRDADDRRATGVSADTCDRWLDLADNVVVEADGSRKRPFKAPGPNEPVIPSRTTLLIACVGARGFGRPIAEVCHRPERVTALAACTVDDVLTPARAATVLLSDQGSRKGLPTGSRFAIVVCQVDDERQPFVDALAGFVGDQASLVAVARAPAR